MADNDNLHQEIKTMSKKDLDKAGTALLKMGPVPHKRPGKPAKKDLERTFKMSVNRQGKPVIR